MGGIETDSERRVPNPREKSSSLVFYRPTRRGVGLLFVDLVACEAIRNKGFPLISGLSQAGSRMVPSGAQIFFASLVNS